MKRLEEVICSITNAVSIEKVVSVQTLWGGYGEIKRYFLEGGNIISVIVKHIKFSSKSDHPRGWNTDRSHIRKLKSYHVESNWYKTFAYKTNETCRIPYCYSATEDSDGLLLIMEDLNAAGFPIRLEPADVSLEDMKKCLSWLAHFHACFMNADPVGLWETGTYWHLDTRPDEWEKMTNIELKKVAKAIDERLSNATFQTLVHGDAKLANFCFSDSADVAAVDFQYVGKGCGMKDVSYFISSCLDDSLCEKYEEELLEYYFKVLESSLDVSIDFEKLKEEWLNLYKFAWADFYRFLDGWSPGHWKMHKYSELKTQEVINEILK